MSVNNFKSDYLADAIKSFRSYKKLAERAIEQVSDEEFFATIDEEANSIALIVKHIAGKSPFALDRLSKHRRRKTRPGSRHRIRADRRHPR